MATETNGIATLSDCNELVTGAFKTYSLNLSGNAYTATLSGTNPTTILPANTALKINGTYEYYAIEVPSTITVTITGTISGDGTYLNTSVLKNLSITVGICSASSSTTFEKSEAIPTFLHSTTCKGSVSIEVPPGIWYLRVISASTATINGSGYSSIVSNWQATTKIVSNNGWCPPYRAILETGKFNEISGLGDNQLVKYSSLVPSFQSQDISVNFYRMIACEPKTNTISLPNNVVYNGVNINNSSISSGALGSVGNQIIKTTTAATANPTVISVTPSMYGTANAGMYASLYYGGVKVQGPTVLSQNGPSASNYIIPSFNISSNYSGKSPDKVGIVITDNSSDVFNFNRGTLVVNLSATSTLTSSGSSTYFNISSSAQVNAITSISYFKNTLAKSGRLCWATPTLDSTVSQVNLIKYDSAWTQGYVHILVGGKLYMVTLSATQVSSLNNGTDVTITGNYIKTIS